MSYSLNSFKGGYIGDYIGFRLNSLKVGYIGDYIGDYHRAYRGEY